jgi:SNF2 family DNA or RNA helicase
MERKFIIALTEHRILGYVFVPYLVELQVKSDYYILVERITNDDTRKRAGEFTDDQRKIVKIIEEYSDSEIVKVFSKKKVANQEFISGLSPDLLNNMIRPYIERRLIKVVEILKSSGIDLYFKDSPKQIYRNDLITIEDTDAEAVFNFIRTESEFKYYLSVSHKNLEMKLTNQPGITLVNEPCHLVLNNRLLVFNDIDGKKLNPFFKNEFVIVPKAREHEYLEKFVANTIKKFKVKCTGFRIEEEKTELSKVLSLEADLAYKPILKLLFDYGKKRVFHAGEVCETSVALEKQNNEYVFFKSARDKEGEQRTIDFLQTLGLKNNNSAFFEIDQVADASTDENLGNLVNWVNTNEKALESFGFELKQEFFEKKFYTGTIELQSSFQKKGDWFDVYAEVCIQGFHIPFIKFRKHIMDGNREYILPNGEVVVLPAEWFAKYSDMFYFGKQEGDHFLFQKYHLKVLQESLGQLNKEYLSSMLQLADTHPDSHSIGLPPVNASLRPYQEEGFAWMYWLFQNNLGACLADDMGLGKTLQTLVLLKKVIGSTINGSSKQLQESGNTVVPPVLIVLPASLVHNWYNEIQKFTPDFKVLKYVGINRTADLSEFNQYNIILTTYGVVRNECELLRDFEFFYIILDESQTIKNADSKIFQAITELKAQHRIVLTGTPIENSLTDLWSQIEFVNPGLLGTLGFFRQYFSNPIEKDNNEERRDKLKRLIQPFILRRTKQEVATDLPPITEQIRLCSMSDEQKNYYEEEKSKVRNEILDNIDQFGVEKSSMVVLNALMRLRQIANHPVMVDKGYTSDSGKFEEVCESIDNMVTENHKVLIFSSFVKHLELFKDYFEKNNIRYSMLTGETRNREEVVANFQNDENNRFFLISLKAGGVGLNLTAADYVFVLDPWWNPAAEMQAINRAHRIGQTNKVFVYRFISAETVEEKIVKLQERKSELADVFINSNNPFKALSRENILELFE